MGGHIGSMLKYAGYDGIVVSGISEKPVYLRIEDGMSLWRTQARFGARAPLLPISGW